MRRITINYSRMLLFLTMFLGLFSPLPAGAQMPPEPQNPVSGENIALQWHTLPLSHARASDILTLMHWNQHKDPHYSFDSRGLQPTPFRVPPPSASVPSIEDNPFLPMGVSRIFALNSRNSLLMEAIKEGFENVRRLVRFLDIVSYEVNPKVSYIIVTEEDPGLTWADIHLQVASGPAVTQALNRLLKSGRTMTTVQTIHEYESREPLAWIVPGYQLGQPRLYSDDSLTLVIDPQDPTAITTETPHLRRGEAMAVKDSWHPAVIFFTVDY